MSVPEWSKNLETGIEEIDNQHRHLIELFHSFYKQSEVEKRRNMIQGILDDLTRYILSHFEDEEELMKASEYPRFEEHKKIHDEMSKKTLEMIQGYMTEELQMSTPLAVFLYEWLTDHIMTHDMKFIEYYRSLDE